jgi:hypothetical protein
MNTFQYIWSNPHLARKRIEKCKPVILYYQISLSIIVHCQIVCVSQILSSSVFTFLFNEILFVALVYCRFALCC